MEKKYPRVAIIATFTNVIKSVAKFFQVKLGAWYKEQEQKELASNQYNTSLHNYYTIANELFLIVNYIAGFQPYIEPYYDLSEPCYYIDSSNYNVFCYQIKLRRAMSPDESKFLRRRIYKQMAKNRGCPISALTRNFELSFETDAVIFAKK